MKFVTVLVYHTHEIPDKQCGWQDRLTSLPCNLDAGHSATIPHRSDAPCQEVFTSPDSSCGCDNSEHLSGHDKRGLVCVLQRHHDQPHVSEEGYLGPHAHGMREDWDADDMERNQIGNAVVRTHRADQCSGEYCAVHKPSDHRMKDWPQHWRYDRGLVERICEHGVGHPDPDHLDHVQRTRGMRAKATESTHGCDGCCA